MRGNYDNHSTLEVGKDKAIVESTPQNKSLLPNIEGIISNPVLWESPPYYRHAIRVASAKVRVVSDLHN